jgi:sRNA-binding carbon storage regulator CsrA
VGRGNLVVTRGEGQRLVLKAPGQAEVWVTVLAAREGKARLSIQAPFEVSVLREELLDEDEED